MEVSGAVPSPTWWLIIRRIGAQVFLETSGKSERKICGISRRLAEEIGGRGPLVSAPRRFVHAPPRAYCVTAAGLPVCWQAPHPSSWASLFAALATVRV